MASGAKAKVGGVSQLAAEVLARLVRKGNGPGPALQDSLIQAMLDAVKRGDPFPLEALSPEIRRARVTASVLADHYIPEVARRLGQMWLDDCASFADVTIGTARLQAILRELGQGWSADAFGAGDGPTLLLILPEGEYHTLGIMVLAARLRRSGVSVSLRIGESAPVLAALAQAQGYRAAMISLPCQDRLESCKKLVKTLKMATKGALKIAVGGALLDQVDTELGDMGADVVTNDIETALIGLGIMSRSAEVDETV